MTHMEALQKQLDAAAPNAGFAVKDKRVARIDFLPTATAQQRQAAERVAAEYDFSKPELKTPTFEERLAALEAKVFVKG